MKKRLHVLTSSASASVQDSLLAECLKATARPQQHRSLNQLARLSNEPQQITRILLVLKSSEHQGHRLALEYLQKLDVEIPTACLPMVLELLADRQASVQQRLHVAGRLLGEQPDHMDIAVQITRAVTTGLSRSRVLQRLLELQSQVKQSQSLDTLVDEQHRKVRLRCPVCRKVWSRSELIVHLWEVHQLCFEAGITLDPAVAIQKMIDTTIHSTDIAAIESAYRKAAVLRRDGHDLEILRLLSCPTDHPPATLTRLAADHHAGLCKACLLELPDAIPALPPPLSIGNGRISGDSYAVEVHDSQLGRVVRVITPDGSDEDAPAKTNRYSPRDAAVWIACPSLLVGLIVVFRIPASPGALFLLVALTLLISAMTYLLVRMVRPNLINRSDLALDVAWQRLATTMDATTLSARWMIRLCRASWNRGDAGERRTPLFHTSNQAEELADLSPMHEQALAALRLLQVMDEEDRNGERTKRLINFFRDFLDGQRSPIFLESVAEMLQDQDFFLQVERLRHPPLALAAAFSSGWTVDELRMLFQALPYTRQWFGLPSEALLRQLFNIWQWRDIQPWSTFGTGIPILELAIKQPSVARRVLQRSHTTTMKIQLDDESEKILGDVLITESGLMIQGILFKDANNLRTERSGRGTGWTILDGVGSLQIDRAVRPEVVRELRNWINWFSEHIASWSVSTAIQPTPRILRRLKCLLSVCPECGLRNIVRRGRLSEAVPEAAG